MPERIAQELQRAAIRLQARHRAFAAGHHRAVEQPGRMIVQRRIGIEHAAAFGLHGANALAHQAHHHARLDQRIGHRRHGRAVHAFCDQDGDLARGHTAIARPGSQGQRG
ncbi:hypothetical protein D3C71_1394380 [compost metagenome]